MSVTMTRSDGVTVFTLTPDPQSSLPPICQILRGLCYSPVCCSVSQRLKKFQGASQSVLGALHIMVGLLNIGLGTILLNCASVTSWQMRDYEYPIWMGVLFILFGIMNILSEKFPSPCLVILSVTLNLSGVAFAIAAIALYIINVLKIWLEWMCDDYDYNYENRHRVTPSPEEMTKCLETQDLVLMILRSINAVLIVLAVLELCVTISSAVLGIKALKQKTENKCPDDPDQYKPLLEEVTSNPAG
ncbi:high affinity immunoglobulin epsilon receptor subunit beta-like [Cheilinus undulatus]|uniref:high affinity immunoglobulin epsilon receptor subunit beta-like n=1 Tax=Cheilinus undulatus TaxID=241271 RepID=UPI001BD26CDD|nr:high affinity immunoglobulin epsilon receptor subunit beta-like [Cheilinus undulatus]XP_041650124.1 high affinity immunoglobulin epsilon receptor subunit beta-like [Cheilinus undulatus]XP_041650125.1 high affinity immunoglobulin epsilon receptor subunit beta-like [Cheilinus undulatus]XP_041650126.1 high affinity immunoglobulin epsilon receptor subunit beta-like [Cheilinus undulatus]